MNVNVDPQLLEILVCPSCRAAVEEVDAGSVLECTGCGYRYPVRDGIPVMLIDEAEKPPLPKEPPKKKGKRR
jgi:uncharacterized protein YbaR (Trm112 family)